MDTCSEETLSSASTPTIHRFTFKKQLCVFCALPLNFQEEQLDSIWDSLNEDTFIEGVSILCDTLNVKDNLNGLFGDGGLDNWRLLGIDNFVQWICCETCYQLISELVSLQQLIVKSQISLKENARKLENFVVVSSQNHHRNTDDFEAPSLEYSVNACVLLRQEILNNYTKNDQPPSRPSNALPRTSRSPPNKQAVVLVEKLEIPPPPIKHDITSLPINETCDEEYIYPSPSPLEDIEKYEDVNEQHEDDPEYQPTKRSRRCTGRKRGRPKKTKPTKVIPAIKENDEEFISASPSPPETMDTDKDSDAKDKGDDQEYQPIKRGRRRPTGRKRGRPKTIKPPKTPGKPGRPRRQGPPPPRATKRRRTRKPAFFLVEEEEPQSEMDVDQEASSTEKHPTIPSTKGGRPLLIGSRHYHLQHEGTGPKLHAIYFLSTSPSPTQNDMKVEAEETNLMIYNVKFSKTSTSLHCLHPDCSHQETLTGYFTDQTILRNMRFHIRFAHRSPPKKDKPEEKTYFYYCHLCEIQIDGKIDFLEHRRQLHTEDDQLPPFCFCDVCGDPSVATGDLVQHVFSHKSELEKQAVLKESKRKGIGKDKDILKPIIHPCDQCDKYFKCHTELMTHRSSHVPLELRRKFVCEICGKGFQNAWGVEHHKRRVHLRDLPMVYECHVCGKGFMRCQKERWQEHLNMHTGERPHQCEQCGKRFIGKWHLTKHVRAIHAGVGGSVTCQFCGKVYKADRYLRKHSLRDHPDKVTSQREGLDEEDKEKYKPLERRQDFIGPKLLFPCEPCGKVFIFKSVLITHLKNRHKMVYERKEDYPGQLTLEDAVVMEPNHQ